MHNYLYEVTNCKKRRIVERLHRERTGKWEFNDRYASPKEDALVKLKNFVRFKIVHGRCVGVWRGCACG